MEQAKDYAAAGLAFAGLAGMTMAIPMAMAAFFAGIGGIGILVGGIVGRLIM